MPAEKKLSLAELRQSPATGLPQRSYELCVATKLLAEMQSLAAELDTLQPEVDEDGKPVGPPKRMGDRNSIRAREIRARMTVLDAEIGEHTGTLVVEAVEPGKWLLWVNAHPAREGNQRDLLVGRGVCNSDDLRAELGTYALTWNGDPIQAGDWDFIESKAGGGDLDEIARLVVTMHATAVDIPKLRRDLLAFRGSAND